MIINMNGAKAPETPSPVLQEKTVTPETLPTVIGADEGYDGLSQVTVNPDSQLKAENIRSGKTIFGVTGAFTGETIMTGGLDMENTVCSITTIGNSYVTGRWIITLDDIMYSTCVYTGEPAKPSEGEYSSITNYLASIRDGVTDYGFSNADGYRMNAGSYAPSNVYTFTNIHFEHAAQSYTTLFMSPHAESGKRLKGTFGMVFILGSEVSANQKTYNYSIKMTGSESYTPPTVDIDCVLGESNTMGKPITFEIPAFTFDCNAYYYYSSFKPVNNRVGLTLMLYPIKAVVS